MTEMRLSWIIKVGQCNHKHSLKGQRKTEVKVAVRLAQFSIVRLVLKKTQLAIAGFQDEKGPQTKEGIKSRKEILPLCL